MQRQAFQNSPLDLFPPIRRENYFDIIFNYFRFPDKKYQLGLKSRILQNPIDHNKKNYLEK